MFVCHWLLHSADELSIYCFIRWKIFHSEKVTFIDYEYAAYNYAAYDIADHFTEYAGQWSLQKRFAGSVTAFRNQ